MTIAFIFLLRRVTYGPCTLVSATNLLRILPSSTLSTAPKDGSRSSSSSSSRSSLTDRCAVLQLAVQDHRLRRPGQPPAASDAGGCRLYTWSAAPARWVAKPPAIPPLGIRAGTCTADARSRRPALCLANAAAGIGRATVSAGVDGAGILRAVALGIAATAAVDVVAANRAGLSEPVVVARQRVRIVGCRTE